MGERNRETHIEVGEHLWGQASCWWYDEAGVAATSNEVDMLDEIMRLRALITEWATALRALREVGLRYGNANWNRAYDRWDAIEKALFEEARREQ